MAIQFSVPSAKDDGSWSRGKCTTKIRRDVALMQNVRAQPSHSENLCNFACQHRCRSSSLQVDKATFGQAMAPIPASLKTISPFLTKAEEMKNADPVVAYYCLTI